MWKWFDTLLRTSWRSRFIFWPPFPMIPPANCNQQMKSQNFNQIPLKHWWKRLQFNSGAEWVRLWACTKSTGKLLTNVFAIQFSNLPDSVSTNEFVPRCDYVLVRDYCCCCCYYRQCYCHRHRCLHCSVHRLWCHHCPNFRFPNELASFLLEFVSYKINREKNIGFWVILFNCKLKEAQNKCGNRESHQLNNWIPK